MSVPTSRLIPAVARVASSSTEKQSLQTVASQTPSELALIRISLEKMAINQQVFLNVDEAAEFTRLSPSVIHRLKNDGFIPYTTGGFDRVVFYKDDLVAYMLKTKTTKTPKMVKTPIRRNKKVLLPQPAY